MYDVHASLKDSWMDPGESTRRALDCNCYLEGQIGLWHIDATKPGWRDLWTVLRGRWYPRLTAKKLGAFQSEAAYLQIDMSRDLNRQRYTDA